MTSQLRTLSLRRVIAGLIAIVCFVQVARLFLAPQLATVAAASVAQPQPAPLPRYVPIPIEQIREGDYVLTRDDHTGDFSSKPVVQSFRRTSDHLRRVEIRTQDGETATIQTTNEHPFWVEGKGWTDAADLQPDDTVTDETGQAVLIASTSYDPHDEGVAVFNFEVAETHSYYVQAPNARGPPVWVHNTCGPDGYVSLASLRAEAEASQLAFVHADQSVLKSIRRHGERLVSGKANPSSVSQAIKVSQIRSAIRSGDKSVAGTYFHKLLFDTASSRLDAFNLSMDVGVRVRFKGGFRVPDFRSAAGSPFDQIYDLKPFKSDPYHYFGSSQFNAYEKISLNDVVPLYYRLLLPR